MDEADLRRRLRRFGGDEAERRAVARAARDLADDGRFAADEGYSLTAEVVADNLSDAREGSPADRWNWWLGALELAHGAAKGGAGDWDRSGAEEDVTTAERDPVADAAPTSAGDRYLAFQVRRWEK